MTRTWAASIHLLLSSLIIITLLAIMLSIWYPGEFFKLMGGDGLIYLIACIDIGVGPLLTFSVYKPGKKYLKFDLCIISLLQIAALTYGCYTIYNARPLFTAYANGEFTVATASEVLDSELSRATKEEWKTRSLTGPVLVAAQPVVDKKDPESIKVLTAFGLGYARFPRFFVAYESQQDTILKTAKSLAELRKIDTKNNGPIDDFIRKQQRPEHDFIYVPISSAFFEMAAILDAKNAAWITIIDVRATPPAS